MTPKSIANLIQSSFILLFLIALVAGLLG